MAGRFFSFVIVSAVFSRFQASFSSRITLKDNGYEDIVIALPPQATVKDQVSLVSNLKDLLEHSSEILATSTKDRASFRSATFLVPPEWGTSWYSSLDDNATTFEEAGATIVRETADIFVFYDSDRTKHPYTLHHEACTHQAMRIYVPSKFLLENTLQERSVEFLRLWSEFRYGMFPEGGFEHDIKYPYRYRTPGEAEDKITGCAGQNFDVPFECADRTDCTEDSFTSSLMDQHLPNSATFFCEGEFSLGPTHNPHSPSKQNLLCKEEGTWHTLLRSQDFAKGKNPALKHRRNTEMKFQFVQEMTSPKVVILIETSAKMNLESRYSLIKNAFSHFVYTNLPKGSELTLMTVDGEKGVQLLKAAIRFSNDEERIQFLEGQPLPEDTSTDNMACVDCWLDHIFELIDDNQTDLPRSPVIVLVTSACNMDPIRYPDIKMALLDLQIQLHILSFGKCEDNGEATLMTLCSETHGQFTHIGSDILGDLYRGFDNAIHNRNKEIMVFQEYLSTEDEETLTLSFNIENRMFQKVRVYISGPELNTGILVVEKTALSCPPAVVPTFRKKEVLSAWIFDVELPIIGGTYNLTTERKRGATSPVLVTVSVQQLNSEDQINLRTWTEMFYVAEISPPPVRIFAELRKGAYPIAGAFVSAKILHPDGELSEFRLIDDGLGNVDVTKDDGIYSHYFTNFTSSGFYNVYIKAERVNETETAEIRGPDGHCCGTSFSGTLGPKMEAFQREAGPATFHVSSIPVDDVYPPSRVTDLSLMDVYDQIYVLNWTAVGDDYDTGVASKYELKLFPDRTVIRHRFNGSGLELYEELIETTPVAHYGKQLIHTFSLPKLKAAGLYYFAIRAIDEAGNAGEPSNALSVWVEHARNRSIIDCGSEETPKPEKYNDATSFVPIASLLLCMLIVRHL